MKQFQVVVVGGGAAGMMAAGRTAGTGTQTLLLEKNKYLGRKIGITGKGRCNLTTGISSIQEIISQYPGNGRFLYSAFSQFSNLDTIVFFNKLGLETVMERGQRVFPASEKALDVAKALEKYVRSGHCTVFAGSQVNDIFVQNGGFVLETAGGQVEARRVILATGGASYPGTGSTGDGYAWAMKLGHTIKPIRPALVPLESSEAWVRDLQGLSLKNVSVRLSEEDGKSIAGEFGEMLFTHFGVSGPVILTLSRLAAVELERGKKPRLHIDLKPALDEETLDRRVQRDFEKHLKKQVSNSLNQLVPKALIPVLLDKAAIDREKPVHMVTREERQRLVGVLKDLSLTLSRTRPLSEAIVTAGGVATEEINPRTMESKITPGLYFAGEIIDIDGNTGGFNLQAAFSTGYVAGNCAAGTGGN